MYHSIYFIDGNVTKNTWTDWHLIPTARPVLPQPSPAYNFVDIPGKDGSLDLSDYLIGRPTYSDRSGAFEFFVDNDHEDWTAIRAALAAFFNGKRMKMWLEDDPLYYYEGRFFFRGWTPDASYSKVTIEYRVSPYRYLVGSDEEAGL